MMTKLIKMTVMMSDDDDDDDEDNWQVTRSTVCSFSESSNLPSTPFHSSLEVVVSN